MKKSIFVLGLSMSAGFAQQPEAYTQKPVVKKPAKPAASAPETAGGLFNQAPPELNSKLVATVQQFYQLHVDGKFRQVIPLVSEDSQDDYFNAEKTKYREFEIVKVEYSKEFTRAKVTTAVGINHVIRGQTMPMKAPMASNWKLEKGEWRWFVDKEAKARSPFGSVTPGPGDPKDFLITRPVTAEQVLGQVKFSKQELRLSSYGDSTDFVVIENKMPGEVSLKYACETLAGLTCSLADTELKPGQKTTLTAKYVPADKSPKPMRRAEVVVTQTAARNVINIVFTVPEEILKNVPKP